MAGRARAAALELARDPGPDPELAEVIQVLARVLSRLIVGVSKGPGAASFRAIATRELRIASDAEVDVIERILGG